MRHGSPAFGSPDLRPTERRRRAPLRAAALFLFLAAGLAASAGEPRKPDSAPPPKPAGEDVPVVKPDENTIYIPYKDLEKVFEKSGRGVFLPYEKFLELWKKSRPPDLAGEEAPPLPAAVTTASYEGTVSEKTAEFKASFQVEVFKKGWTQVPFSFGNLAIGSLQAKEGGVLAPTADGGTALVVKAPGTYRLELGFSVKVEEGEGERSFRFQAPAASLARFSVVLPGQNLKVDLKPNLAASETPEGADRTRLFAFLGPSRDVEVKWRAQAERKGQLAPILHPTVESKVKVEEGVVEVEASVAYKILQAPADRFRVLFPKDCVLIGYDGANILREEIAETPDGKVLDIRLHSGAKDAYALRIRLQKGLKEAAGELVVPVVSALDVQREEGTIAVDLLPPLKGKVLKRTGLSQVDVGDLPAALKTAGVDFGFKYLRQPVALSLEVEKEQPEVSSECRGAVLAVEGRLEFVGTLRVNVDRVGIFGLRLLVPGDFKIQRLHLQRPGDLNYTVREGEGGVRRIEITFDERMTGSFPVAFEFRWERPGELDRPFDLPWIRVPEAKKDRGWIGLQAKEGYDLRLSGKAVGFEARPAAEVEAQTGAAPQLGFVYNLTALDGSARPEFQARIEVVKRPSRVSAEVLTDVFVSDAAVEVEHAILYLVEQAGASKFSYSLPEALFPAPGAPRGAWTAGWEVLDPEVDGKKQHTAAADGARGRRVFEVEIQKEQMGTVRVTVKYKLPLKDRKPGEEFVEAIPDLLVEKVFQTTGQVGVRKSDNIVLLPHGGRTLHRADLSELQPELQGRKPFSAFRYTEHESEATAWELKIAATKYDYEKALPTVLNHLHVDAAVTEDREVRVFAILALQNKERQSLRLRFPAGSKNFQVFVDGKRENVSRSAEGDETVKLVSLSSVRGREDEFLVTLYYDVPPAAKGRMRVLETGFPVSAPGVLGGPGEADPPASRLTLDLYLPADYRYLSFSTDMTRLTRTRGIWERIRDFFLGAGGKAREAGDVDQAVRTIKARAAAKKAPGEPDFAVLQKKELHRFYKTSAGGEVRFASLHPALFQVLNVGALILAVAALVFLPYRQIAGAAPLAAGFAAACLVASALSEWLTPFAGTVFLGTLAASLFWVGEHVLVELPKRWKAARASTRRLPPAGAAPPAPPSAPPGPDAAAPKPDAGADKK